MLYIYTALNKAKQRLMSIFCFSNSLSDKTIDAVCNRGDVVNMLEIEKSIGIETSVRYRPGSITNQSQRSQSPEY